MIMTLRPACATCRFFERFTEETTANYMRPGEDTGPDGEEIPGVPILATDATDDLLEYGRCLRNPPQFFSETLNGEWPVVHEDRVCGEYQLAGSHKYKQGDSP